MLNSIRVEGLSGDSRGRYDRVKRRLFLQSVFGYVSGFLIPRSTVAHSNTPITRGFDSEIDSNEIVLTLFSRPEYARDIGHRYIARYPECSDRDTIINELRFPRLAPGGRRHDTIRHWVEQSQRRDFYEGRTVVVDCWILSRTEACLCALAALS